VKKDLLTKEQKIRKKYPVVQEAWDKYLVLLKIHDTGEFDDDVASANDILTAIRLRKDKADKPIF
jgi:hypothetical protein